MALSDKAAPVAGVPNYSARIARQITSCLAQSRNCLAHVQRLLDKSGDKAAVCTDFGNADCQEAVDIIGPLTTLVNAHLPAGMSAVIEPLVQADVPA